MYRGDVSSRETRTFDAGQLQLPRVRAGTRIKKINSSRHESFFFRFTEPLRMNQRVVLLSDRTFLGYTNERDLDSRQSHVFENRWDSWSLESEPFF